MLTLKGFRPSRFSEVAAKTKEVIQSDFGNTMDLSSDALMGVYSDIMSLSEAYLWELSQGVYDSSNLLSAEGVMLENLALIVGYIRLAATHSRGVVWFTAADGTIVPQGATLQSIVGDFFLIETETEITSTSCIEVTLSVNTLIQGDSYTLEAGALGSTNTYRRESTPNQTKEEIILFFEEALRNDNQLVTRVEGTGEESVLVINKEDTGQNMSVSGTSYFSFSSVVAPAIAQAMQAGELPANAHTITSYLTEGGVLVENSVDNPFDFITGRDTETDLELRQRVIRAYQAIAGGTADSIYSTVSAIAGVDSVKVVENRTDTGTGFPKFLPPKSFQVIVHNGDDQLIAEEIWRQKPAAIQCYADPTNPLTTTVRIEDFNGQPHNVSFVRPTTKYIWVHVDFSLYDEEAYPTSGELIIQEELSNYGDSLIIGADVIADRFIPHVYRNVKGVEDVEIWIAVSDNLDNIPLFPSQYTQGTIDITDEEITNFSPQRVETHNFGLSPIIPH